MTQLSIGHLILQASILVQFILLLLLAASVISWAVIFGKRKLLSSTRGAADDFEERFWSGGTLVDLFKQVQHARQDEGLVANARERGDQFLAGLHKLQTRHRSIGDVRGLGLMLALELVKPDEGDGRTFAEMADDEKHALSHRGRALRALVQTLSSDRFGSA